MSARLLAVGLLALVLAGCGGDDGGEDRAGSGAKPAALSKAEFARRSNAECRRSIAATLRAGRAAEGDAAAAAVSGDPERIRRALLGLVDDLAGALRPFFARGEAIVPPTDRAEWENLNADGRRAFERLIGRLRTELRKTDFTDEASLTSLATRLAGVEGDLERLTRRSDVFYRRFGATECLSDRVEQALGDALGS